LIDLHSHILPGLDDGAADTAEAVAIARAAVADGITGMAATPHVREDYPTEASAMRARLAELRESLAEAGVPLELHSGGEVALTHLDRLDEDELRAFALAGSRYLLLEFPYQGWPLDLRTRIFELQVAGLVPVLAHPERNPETIAAPNRVAALVEAGALVQLTASSLDGRGGRAVAETARYLLDAGVVHLVASDAHAPAVRGVGLAGAVEAVGDEPLARWLTELVPAAIVADAPVPPRPASTAKRRRWRLARG
jgi:protein-tyrosine phosphatase